MFNQKNKMNYIWKIMNTDIHSVLTVLRIKSNVSFFIFISFILFYLYFSDYFIDNSKIKFKIKQQIFKVQIKQYKEKLENKQFIIFKTKLFWIDQEVKMQNERK